MGRSSRNNLEGHRRPLVMRVGPVQQDSIDFLSDYSLML